MLLPELHLRCYTQDTVSHQHENIWQIIFWLNRNDGSNFNRQDFLFQQNYLIIPPTIDHAFAGHPIIKILFLELPVTSQWRLNERGECLPITAAIDY